MIRKKKNLTDSWLQAIDILSKKRIHNIDKNPYLQSAHILFKVLYLHLYSFDWIVPVPERIKKPEPWKNIKNNEYKELFNSFEI